MSWVPDVGSIIMYVVMKVQKERRDMNMKDTTEKELMIAIQIFKERYGIKTPLDMFKLDEIIDELKKGKK